MVDHDADTVAVLRAWKAERSGMALALAKPGALAFGTIEGEHRNGEHVSRQFGRETERCQAVLGTDAVPGIGLHDLRHTMATVMLLNGDPVHVVGQRLGHASPMVTLIVYAHVMPGNQRDAADAFARLIREAKGA